MPHARFTFADAASICVEPFARRPEFATEPGYRPGERMVAGRPYTYNADALADWLAVDAKRTAPDDLTALSDAELVSLGYRASRIDAMSAGRDPDLMRRVQTERARRGLNVAFLDEGPEAGAGQVGA